MNKESILQKLSYRNPMVVKSGIVYRDNSLYAICPRCKQAIDREYQVFCDRCGQCLEWGDFDNINIVYLSQI